MAEWTEDQLVLALEFYYSCPENNRTDAHVTCQEIAALVGHSAAALDRTLRNIKFVDSGGTGLEHASALVYRLVDQHKSNIPSLKADAAAIRNHNGWPSLKCGA